MSEPLNRDSASDPAVDTMAARFHDVPGEILGPLNFVAIDHDIGDCSRDDRASAQ
jgi:hypothetical protein